MRGSWAGLVESRLNRLAYGPARWWPMNSARLGDLGLLAFGVLGRRVKAAHLLLFLLHFFSFPPSPFR